MPKLGSAAQNAVGCCRIIAFLYDILRLHDPPCDEAHCKLFFVGRLMALRMLFSHLTIIPLNDS